MSELTAERLSQGIAARRFSCREVVEAILARIAKVNPAHYAIVSMRDPDVLLLEADERGAELARGERRGWLHGIPQAIKDAMAVAGIRSTMGSPLLADVVPSQDDLLVQRTKAASAIVIGRTNSPELGLGSRTFNEVHGLTRNAYDPSRSAGDSSGGAAVALALRMLAVADGSDFVGSLRNPAGWNGSTALARAKGACRTGRSSTPMSRNCRPAARWRATCSTSRVCSTCRRATTRASRSRSTGSCMPPMRCSPRRPTTRACALAGSRASTATSRSRTASWTCAMLRCDASRPWARRWSARR